MGRWQQHPNVEEVWIGASAATSSRPQRQSLLNIGGYPMVALRSLWAVFLELFVHSTLWMSFSLASLVFFVQLECGQSALDWRPFRAGAAESVAVYCIDHLRDIRKATASTGAHKVGDGRWGKTWRPLMLWSLFVVALTTFMWVLLTAPSVRVAATFFIHLVLCGVYAKLKSRMPYLKALYVSLCVLFMAFAAPEAYVPGLLGGLGWAALARLAVLVLGVAFTVENLQDLRDVSEDTEAGVVTLPSGLGEQRAVRLLVATQVLCGLAHWGLVCLSAPRAVAALRPDFIAVHVLCALMAGAALKWHRRWPRSVFQVAVEPLHTAPLLVALAARPV